GQGYASAQLIDALAASPVRTTCPTSRQHDWPVAIAAEDARRSRAEQRMWGRSGALLSAPSHRLLHVQAHRVHRIGVADCDQFPALARMPVEFFLDLLCQLAVEQGGGDFNDLVFPALAHDCSSRSPGSGACGGSRPALRSASRSTYSICALRLRSSSSDHFCAAASTSALIRSG